MASPQGKAVVFPNHLMSPREDADLVNCFPCGRQMQSSMTDERTSDRVQQRDPCVAGGRAPFASPLPSITREVRPAQPRGFGPACWGAGREGRHAGRLGGSQLDGRRDPRRLAAAAGPAAPEGTAAAGRRAPNPGPRPGGRGLRSLGATCLGPGPPGADLP